MEVHFSSKKRKLHIFIFLQSSNTKTKTRNGEVTLIYNKNSLQFFITISFTSSPKIRSYSRSISAFNVVCILISQTATPSIFTKKFHLLCVTQNSFVFVKLMTKRHLKRPEQFFSSGLYTKEILSVTLTLTWSVYNHNDYHHYVLHNHHSHACLW